MGKVQVDNIRSYQFSKICFVPKQYLHGIIAHTKLATLFSLLHFLTSIAGVFKNKEIFTVPVHKILKNIQSLRVVEGVAKFQSRIK